MLESVREEELGDVSVVKDMRVVQFSATASSAAGEVSRMSQSVELALHPMRMTDEELQGEVWDLLVKAVDKYNYVPGVSDFDCVDFMREYTDESEGSLFMKDVMFRSVHAGLSLAARVVEHVDTLRTIRRRGPRDYDVPVSVTGNAPTVMECEGVGERESENSGSSTEVYSHWEGDPVWKRSLSKRTSSSSSSDDDDARSGPYENV